MNGKLVASAIVLTAAAAGIGVYYTQEYAYYQPVVFTADNAIKLTPLNSDTAEPISVSDLQAIDAASSPLRFRACFTTKLDQTTLLNTYKTYDKAVPLYAPSWFDCFDAKKIDDALTSGEAVAFLAQANIAPDIDRVIAVFRTGEAYAWHQVNPNAQE